jgi:acyl carrier protein
MANEIVNEAVRSAVLSALAGKLSAAARGRGDIDEKSPLLELGLIDSEDLIEIILEVEQQCTCEFNPEQMDLEAGLTLGGLISAFMLPR